ncbi:hypothetical protein AMATHDRAFT_8566 [Amanita thiersii Skay4041]|uniref:Uncharacterized protein n=1 Tax=Amanita thiersii Skay4041 TaxID=703135 RepID=A0A2A9NDR2_9AGAR|nr:hypothetical protein AMATHDRAFT_8566 [Amanita thiersii Skay4041]
MLYKEPTLPGKKGIDWPMHFMEIETSSPPKNKLRNIRNQSLLIPSSSNASPSSSINHLEETTAVLQACRALLHNKRICYLSVERQRILHLASEERN